MARNAEKDGFSHVFRILPRICVFSVVEIGASRFIYFSLEDLFYFVENLMTKKTSLYVG